MVKNRIRALIYDPATFPLAPTSERYKSVEQENEIFFYVIEKGYSRHEMMTEFDPEEKGFANTLPAGDYYVHLRVLDGDDRFKIEFSFCSEGSSDIAHKHIFDVQTYFNSCERAFKNAISKRTLIVATEDEETFSMNYLRKSFKGLIEGNDDFWLHFYTDLDVAIAPINLAILRETLGLPRKPMRIGGDTPSPTPFMN